MLHRRPPYRHGRRKPVENTPRSGLCECGAQYAVSKANNAFTLIELLVVIAIIALLIAILIPSLMKAKSLAVRLRCSGNLKQTFLAVQMYTDNNDHVYMAAQDPVSTDPFYWLWMGRGWRSYLEPYLGGPIDVNNPSVLYCPGDPDSKQQYEATSYAYSMAFYHSPEQIDAMTDKAATYSNPQPLIKQRRADVSFPDGKILIGEWQSNHQRVDNEAGWWNWEGTRNYLFADGHAEYLEAEEIRPANDNLPDANLTKNGIKGRDHPR